jgi:hypothetical protein
MDLKKEIIRLIVEDNDFKHELKRILDIYDLEDKL